MSDGMAIIRKAANAAKRTVRMIPVGQFGDGERL
jgi:hypothetical protein